MVNKLISMRKQFNLYRAFTKSQGRGPGAVVKAACLESRRSRVQSLRTQLWHSSIKEQNVSFPLTRIDSILWEPPLPRGSVLGLRPNSVS